MYMKAGRAIQVPVALEISRSGIGAHAWTFFTSPIQAELARRLGTGLLREAMAPRGRMTLTSYDRLFPSQDLVPSGGLGNLSPPRCSGPRGRSGDGVSGYADPGAAQRPVGVSIHPRPGSGRWDAVGWRYRLHLWSHRPRESRRVAVLPGDRGHLSLARTT